MTHKTTIDQYISALSAKTPTPGGGSAAALVGLLALGLLSMASKYVSAKMKNKSDRDIIERGIKFADDAKRYLRHLMSEDEEAYAELDRAIKSHKKESLVSLYKNASAIPLEICIIAYEGIGYCEILSRYCKTWLIADIAEAAVLFEGAYLSAEYVIEVNLRCIHDKSYLDKTYRSLERYEAQNKAAKKKIIAKWKKFIGER